jgi:hypothetical protein
MVTGSTPWSCSLKPKCCLTISASSCAISMYVVSFLEAQALPDDFHLFVCHQYVRGLVPSSTSTTSRFLPLSGSTWSRSLKHKHCLTISPSSCVIRAYVVSNRGSNGDSGSNSYGSDSGSSNYGDSSSGNQGRRNVRRTSICT